MSSGRPVTLILAAAVPSLAIGRGGTLPWRLAKEMKYFRQVTTNGIVIMGRKTWESIPAKFRPLADRTNVVITRSPENLQLPDSVLVASSLEDAQSKVAHLDGRLFVIGGAQLYKSALQLPSTKHVLLTEISHEFPDCDAFFDYFPWYSAETATPEGAEWTRRSFDQLKEFLGDQIQDFTGDDGSVEEKGIPYTFTLWSRD
ncbi:dihydrofolate reductase [Sugiyamaella lignohabitans]|uniref:Dihydrofolate reductase n=1 Tax=Sugiyamaella lignohabitans TaxID=796027 RepID=A0A167FPM6_9ASCO|nr:dihydrofolate reductase [Sugiyamaella lignohabitans]ANB15544.1 dihydrofolate reductase [Sugiyamaella lignohabitans]